MWSFIRAFCVRKYVLPCIAAPVCFSLFIFILFHRNSNLGFLAEKFHFPLLLTVHDPLEPIQSGRRNSIQENCRNIILSRTRPAARFYVDERHQLLFCYIPKVASTNLKRLMLVLSGTVDSKNFSSVSRTMVHMGNPMRRIEPQNADELARHELGEYKKLIFVRHPFERLVSAYYSKLARGNKTENNPDPITKDTTEYSQMVGTKIIQKYRPNATKLSLERGHDVTIPEFVSYVIDEWTERNKTPVDEHWRSQVDLCHPCSIKYDIIGKFETIEQDVDYLLRRLEENEFNQFFKSNEPYSTSSLVGHFLYQLTRCQVSDLYRIYQEDFTVFGYEPNVQLETNC